MAKDAIAEIGLDLSSFEAQIKIAVAELEKLDVQIQKGNDKLEKMKKHADNAAEEFSKLKKAIVGSTIAVVALKVGELAKGLYDSYINTKKLNNELESVGSGAGAGFKSQGDISAQISAGRGAIGKGGEALGLSDVKDPAKTFGVAIDGMKAFYADFAASVLEGEGRLIDTQQEGFEARKKAIEQLGVLETQYYNKQTALSKNAIDASSKSAKQAALDLIQIRKKENENIQGGATKEARKAQADAAKKQADVETAQVEKQFLFIGAELKAREDIANIQGTGYILEKQTLEIQEEKNKTLLSSGQLNKEESRDISAQNQMIAKQLTDLDRMHDIQIKSAKSATEILALQIAGNEQLAKLAQIRASYSTQIAQANQQGDSALAEQLKNQQALTELAERARQHDVSSNERSKERAEQRKQERSIRQEAQREIDQRNRQANGAYGYSDSRISHTNEYTNKILGKYQAQQRNGRPVNDTGNKAGDIVAKQISSTNMQVETLKNAD